MNASVSTEWLDVCQVDVFTERLFAGNPAAVVSHAGQLSKRIMLDIAREMNLSETVFLSPPRNHGDYFLETFTVNREIPFAVHASIAAAHAFVETRGGNAPGLLRQECTAGVIELNRLDDGWFFSLPPAVFSRTEVTPASLAPMLGLQGLDMVGQQTEIVAVGPRWLLVELGSRDALRRVAPNYAAIAALTASLPAVGLTAFVRSPSEGIEAELRAFAPAEGIFEDPVCGSCAGSLAALMRRENARFAADAPAIFEQGHAMRRPGQVLVRYQDDQLRIGGTSITALRGRVKCGERQCLD
jgi:PhzF family phenazine biosynthesis protein